MLHIHRGLREQYLSGGYNYPGGESDYRADLARASKNLTEASAAVDELDEVVEEPADLYPWTTLSAIDVKWAKATNEEKNKTNIFIADIQGGYLINPMTNLKLFGSFIYRNFQPAQVNSNALKENTTWFSFGIRSDVFNWYFDY